MLGCPFIVGRLASRLLLAVLAVLLGWLAPLHAGGPSPVATDDVAIQLPAVAPRPVVQVFLVAYRGQGPPVLVFVPIGGGPAFAAGVDALYSPQAVTNEAGQVVERYSYTAFGERTVLGGYSSTTSRIGFNHGFTGLRDEGGLLFARNRYFSPELGRWISRDPAGYVNGYGLYAGYFAPNGMDPEGLATECPDEQGEMVDADALMAALGVEYASESGVLDAQPSAMHAALTAYRYMGYEERDAWEMAKEWHEVASGSTAESLSPLFYISDDYETLRDQVIRQHEVAMQMADVRRFRQEAVSDLFSMAIDDFSPLLMMGGGMMAGSARAVSGLVSRGVSSSFRQVARSTFVRPAASRGLVLQRQIAKEANIKARAIDRWLGSSGARSSRYGKAVRTYQSIVGNAGASAGQQNFAKLIRGRFLDRRMNRWMDTSFRSRNPGLQIRLDRRVPGSGSAVRPDVYIHNVDGRRYIFDFGGPSKVGDMGKYSGLADELVPIIPVPWVP